MTEQGSPEWHQERLGKVTASRIACVMAKGKDGKPAKTRENYLAELVCERLTGVPHDGFKSRDMERGNEMEAEAVTAYEFETGQSLSKIGFVAHPVIEMSGASPDQLVGKNGLAEFKCPISATHLANLEGATIDRLYRLQMQWQMACTGRQWCDFVSYDPRFGTGLELSIVRVNRDDALIAEVEAEVSKFLAEVSAKVDALQARRAS